MIQDYKKNTVEDIKQRIDGAKSIVLIDYKGINVEEVNELRRRMFEEKVDFAEVQSARILKLEPNKVEAIGEEVKSIISDVAHLF